MKAVNSEHEASLNDDDERLSHLLKTKAKEGHPYTKFQSGNLKSLNHENIREDIMKFYDKYYSSDLMSFAVISKHGMEKLEELVRKYFEKVENKGHIPPNAKNKPPFTKDELG